MRQDYDTKEGIAKFLTSLSGIRSLEEKRRKAGYDKGERLNDFYILGRWCLDSCGNFGKITGETIPKNLLPNIPDVLTREELWEYLKANISDAENIRISSIFNSELPPGQTVCSECGEGWDINNCHDVSIKRHSDGVQYFHKFCNRKYLARKQREEFENIIVQAGFDNFWLIETKNQYCPCEICAPWFGIQTPCGEILIGWRKRVINIDWSKTGKNLLHLFEKEDVTKERYLIHAWSYKKAADYLNRIYKTLST